MVRPSSMLPSQEILDSLKHLKKDPNRSDSQGAMEDRIEARNSERSKAWRAEMKAKQEAEAKQK